MGERLRIFNNAGDRCLTNPPSGFYLRPWTRFDYDDVCREGFTQDQLDMRRKYEILQYNKNQNNLTKKQQYVHDVKGISATTRRRQFASQPLYNNTVGNNVNVDRLNQSGATLVFQTCTPQAESYTTDSDVPGPRRRLFFDRTVPLTRYVPVRRTYKGAEGSKWPFIGGPRN